MQTKEDQEKVGEKECTGMRQEIEKKAEIV